MERNEMARNKKYAKLKPSNIAANDPALGLKRSKLKRKKAKPIHQTVHSQQARQKRAKEAYNAANSDEQPN